MPCRSFAAGFASLSGKGLKIKKKICPMWHITMEPVCLYKTIFTASVMKDMSWENKQFNGRFMQVIFAIKNMKSSCFQIDELAKLTDNAYTRSQIIRMEQVVLRVLNLELHMPEPSEFLGRFLQIEDDRADKEVSKVMSRHALHIAGPLLGEPSVLVVSPHKGL